MSTATHPIVRSAEEMESAMGHNHLVAGMPKQFAFAQGTKGKALFELRNGIIAHIEASGVHAEDEYRQKGDYIDTMTKLHGVEPDVAEKQYERDYKAIVHMFEKANLPLVADMPKEFAIIGSPQFREIQELRVSLREHIKEVGTRAEDQERQRDDYVNTLAIQGVDKGVAHEQFDADFAALAEQVAHAKRNSRGGRSHAAVA